VRITPELRKRLDAARRSGEVERSLNQEIELRLRQSFDLEQKIETRFHGQRIYLVMQIIADQISLVETATGRSCWEDPYTFQQAANSITTIIRFFKPKGRTVIPKQFSKEYAKAFGENTASARLMLYETYAKAKEPPLDADGLRIYSGAPNIVAQLAKSGKYPSRTGNIGARLARQRQRVLDSLADLPEKEPNK
jgi:hypothetical protein